MAATTTSAGCDTSQSCPASSSSHQTARPPSLRHPRYLHRLFPTTATIVSLIATPRLDSECYASGICSRIFGTPHPPPSYLSLHHNQMLRGLQVLIAQILLMLVMQELARHPRNLVIRSNAGYNAPHQRTEIVRTYDFGAIRRSTHYTIARNLMGALVAMVAVHIGMHLPVASRIEHTDSSSIAYLYARRQEFERLNTIGMHGS
jgi:hypothetical protein